MARTDFVPADGTAWEDLIRKAAYAIYEQRGREDGHDMDDWLLAEARIINRYEANSSIAPKK